MRNGDTLFLTDGSTLDRISDLQDGEEGHGSAVAWQDDRTAYVLFGQSITRVTADGPQDSTRCEGCRGLSFTGGRLFTARENFRPADGFDIVGFDTELNEVRSVPAARVIERAGRQQLSEVTGPPELVAVTPDWALVSHVSRQGGARHGPYVLTKYSPGGTRLGHTVIDGVVFDVEPAPDLRYVAMSVGGSSGACVTPSELRVVNTVSLEELKTDPVLPSAANASGAAWYETQSIFWQREQIVATGTVHDPPLNESCDEHPDEWVRHYDPSTQQFTDGAASGTSGMRVIGPECEDKLGYASGQPFGTVVSARGENNIKHLMDEAEILGVTAGGRAC